MLPLVDPAVSALRRWLRVRRSLVVAGSRPDEKALFVNCQARRAGHRLLESIVRKSAQKAGLRCRVTPTVIRQSLAAHLLDKGANMRTVQVLLGHSWIMSTAKYSRLAVRRLAEVYDRSHPRPRLLIGRPRP